jgi:hypothetical protein
MSWRKRRGDVSEEIQEHLREKVEELVAGGMSREEAAFAARGCRGGDGVDAGFGNRREYRDLQAAEPA